jgi:2-polyprenyl-6-methoxyphenol hydroxylase-like FAD-dependent oxidoreductase
MLLARRGHRVLLVDRATFPSDTISTHVVQPTGVAALSRWGLLDRLTATGCPPIHTYAYDFGPFAIEGSPGTRASPVAYSPRRTVLDKILVDAAVEAGVEVREGFTVDRVLSEQGRVVGIEGRSKGGAPVTERARVVVGADGKDSRVVAAVRPERYDERPAVLASYYTYWSGLPVTGRFETWIRPRRGMAAMPTHDGLTLVIAGWPYAEFEANRRDVEGSYRRTIELVPELAGRLRKGRREARFAGAAVPGSFRKPWGPGWALVGDAGYVKDPITAQGIRDAFLDAERCSAALDAALTGARPFDEAMAGYQRARDEDARPMYEFTCMLATLEPPPAEMQAVLGALPGHPAAMDRFAQMNAGTISPAAFFAPESVAAILSAAKAPR